MFLSSLLNVDDEGGDGSDDGSGRRFGEDLLRVSSAKPTLFKLFTPSLLLLLVL